MANRHGWSQSEASARLVEEGLRRADFAFIDFRDSVLGRQACIQGSTLAVWEVMLIARSHDNDAEAVAKHLQWPLVKVQAAFTYARAFSDEITEALAEYDASGFESLKRMLPQVVESVVSQKSAKHSQTC